MLQNIRDKSSGWIAYVILGLIIVTMAFFGIESYFAPKLETFSARIEGPAKFLGWGGQSVDISASSATALVNSALFIMDSLGGRNPRVLKTDRPGEAGPRIRSTCTFARRRNGREGWMIYTSGP